MMNRRATNEKKLLLDFEQGQLSYEQGRSKIISQNRRKFLKLPIACGLILKAQHLLAELPPGPGPATLERRIERNTVFILVGTPKRIMYVPEEFIKKFYEARWADPEYALLKKNQASELDYKKFHEKFQKKCPINEDEFRLRPETELTGAASPFLEFDIKRVEFKKTTNDSFDMSSKIQYFKLGPGLRRHDEYRHAWESVLGKEVILLTSGVIGPSAITYLPYPFPVHVLAMGNHWRDHLPISMAEFSEIRAIARRLNFVRP